MNTPAIAPNDANTLDSRGFVHLRLGRLAESVDDYDAALKINPDEAQSLFGRGIAKLRRGDTAGAGADLAAAKAIKPSIADKFFGYGIYSPLIITPASGAPEH